VFDPQVRRRLAAGARATRASLRTWDAASSEMAAALVQHG